MKNAIAILREQKGYSQRELVDMFNEGDFELKISQSSMSQWENGVTKPCKRRMERLAEILGVTVDELRCALEQKTPIEQPTANPAEESPSLTDVEKHLLDCFRSVDESGKRMILSVADLEYERRRNEIVG